MGMLKGATIEISKQLPGTYDQRWRKAGRRKLKTWALKMITNYEARQARADKNDHLTCDPQDDDDLEEEEDELERGLSVLCKEKAKGIRDLGAAARNWSSKYNSDRCGGKPDKPGFRDRTWKALRNIRKTAYCALGCTDRCDGVKGKFPKGLY